jgi:predicted P-loop ATPase
VPTGATDPLVPWLVDNMGARDGDPMQIICPWAAEHTDGRPDAAYWPLGSNNRASRGFRCLHSHCAERDTEAFLDAVVAAGGPRYSTTGDVEVPKSWRDAIPTVRVEVLPDLRLTAKGEVSVAQMATAANVEAVIDALGMQCRYNMLSKDTELSAPWHWSPQRVHVELHSACMKLGITNRAAIDDAIAAVAQERRYHPLADQIRGVEWDGRDRWSDFIRTVGVVEGQDPELPAILLRRWVLQAVKAWTTTTPTQVGGVLVLVGPQYRGKSRWCKRLTPYRCRDGLLAPHLKDSVLQALRGPVFEMSELEGTFRKSDIAALKAFLTQDEDVLRVPYARVADKWPRQTVFAASVNEVAFLVDATGNRRFWCIEIDRMDADHDVDMLQLYAQALAELESGEQWWLTEEEHQLQMAAAEEFTTPDAVEDLYRDYIDKRMRLPKTAWNKVNTTMMARLIGLEKTDKKTLAGLKTLLVQDFGRHRQFGSRRRKGWHVPVTTAELQTFGLQPLDDG